MGKGFETNNSNNIEPTTCARNVRQSRSFDRREIRTTRERSRGEVHGGGFILYFYGAREQTQGLQRQPYFLLVYQSTPSQQAHL